jgi:phosphate transport system permease protein
MTAGPSTPLLGGLEPLPVRRGRGQRSPWSSWRWSDRAIHAAAWGSGLLLCLIAGALVLFLAIKGIQYLRPALLVTRPQAGIDQSQTGGFLDPILGTIILSVIGIGIATPVAAASAVWLSEYGRPRGLARAVESSIEIIAGTPDIVLAIFGLALFQTRLLGPLSFTSSSGGVFGRSFFAAGAMLSLVAIPSVFTAARSGLEAIPRHQREGAYALGKTRIATIRRVLLPAMRPDLATGVTLGIGRIVGDTAIVLVLLGGTLRLEPQGGVPGLGLLRGTGSSLTTYISGNSPAGEGNAPQKAYAAAFVLLIIVLLLNTLATRVGRRGAVTAIGGLGT